jgi:phosphoglycolate phosphatase-like HAD superfamily hydrolase
MPRLAKQTRKPIKADAVLWDFDGTLADSAAKNIAITKQILAQVAPRLTGDNLPRCLQSVDDYHIANHGADHWRDLYADFFGMTLAEILAAEPLWELFQAKDNTAVTLFDGITDTLSCLAHLPHGICSANAERNIRQILNQHDLDTAFRSIIGYEDLPHHQQKPNPDGGLICLQDIFALNADDIRGKTIIYIGDHVADAMFARGLGQRLEASNIVVSVAVTYSGAQPENWAVQPDEVIGSAAELTDWIKE